MQVLRDPDLGDQAPGARRRRAHAVRGGRPPPGERVRRPGRAARRPTTSIARRTDEPSADALRGMRGVRVLEQVRRYAHGAVREPVLAGAARAATIRTSCSSASSPRAAPAEPQPTETDTSMNVRERFRPWSPGAVRGSALIGVLVALVMVWAARLVEEPRRLVDRRRRERLGRGRRPTRRSRRRPPPTLPPYDGWVNPASAQEPWDTTTVRHTSRSGATPPAPATARAPSPATPRCSGRTRRAGACADSRATAATCQTWCGDGWTGNPNVFERDGKHVGVVRWLRLRAPLARRRHRRRDREDLQDRRPGQGLDDHRPRRLPAQLQGLPRQQLLRRRHRSGRPARGALEAERLRERRHQGLERRLGRRGA